MANQIRVQVGFDYLADGASNTITLNLFRSPLTDGVVGKGVFIGAYGLLANSFGGTTELPSSIIAAGSGGVGATTASIDNFGNVLVTFTNIPPAGTQSVTLTLLFA